MKLNCGRAATDKKCRYRKCFSIMQNKGPFTPNKGYTSYYKDERWGCRRNFLAGCPSDEELELDLVKITKELRDITLKARWDKSKILYLISLLEEVSSDSAKRGESG